MMGTEGGAANNQGMGWKRKMGLLLFGGMTLGTGLLGTWQATRYAWKVNLIHERRELLAKAPVRINAGEVAAKAGSFSPVLLRGRFIHDREVYLGIRSAPKHTTVAEHPTAPKSGYYVFTPFETSDGRTVLVNRGWVPQGSLPHIKGGSGEDGPPIPRPEGQVTLRGCVVEGEKPTSFSLPPDEETRVFYWLDIKTMAQVLGVDVDSCVVEVTSGHPEDKPPRNVPLAATRAGPWPLPRPVTSYTDFYIGPEVHKGYSATWYGLSSLGLFMTYKLLRHVPKVRR